MDDSVLPSTPSTNTNTELAKERNHAAYDRTLMAWIRTALSLIGFGIGIFEFTQKTGGETIFRSSKLVGLLLVLLGIVSVVLAIRENKMLQRQLRNPEIKYSDRSSLATTIGYGLIIIGIYAVYHIIGQIIKLGL
jgi:inner membrane protein YidH